MRKQITWRNNTGTANIAWLSFQPDWSISFGLNDRTFVAPRFGAKAYVFNAYNRVRSEFLVSSDGAGLNPIRNPHFTYHPSVRFHLTGNGDEDVFDGIADLPLILSQQSEFPWIRAITSPLNTLPVARTRDDGIETDRWELPPFPPNTSARISIDLLRPAPLATRSTNLVRLVPWGDAMARIEIDNVSPQQATLSWFHEY